MIRKTANLPERSIYYAGNGTGKHPGTLVKSSEYYVPKNRNVGLQGKLLRNVAEGLNKKKRAKDLKFAQDYLG